MEEELQRALREFADKLIAFYKGRAPVASGALRNSIRAEVRSTGEIAIIYNRYGAYQDLGVKGWQSADKAPNSPFQYKRNNANNNGERPGPVGGNFGSFGGRVNIRKFGLAPKYWITSPAGDVIIPQDAIASLEQSIASSIEQFVTSTTQRTRS